MPGYRLVPVPRPGTSARRVRRANIYMQPVANAHEFYWIFQENSCGRRSAEIYALLLKIRQSFTHGIFLDFSLTVYKHTAVPRRLYLKFLNIKIEVKRPIFLNVRK